MTLKNFAKPYALKNRFLSSLLGKKYFGLAGLDKKLLEFIDYRNGYFVELGANDGITQSNTKHLELFLGWRGILIEPSPRKFTELKKFRSRKNLFFNCACVAFDFSKPEIEMLYSNLMSVTLEGRSDIPDRLEHAKKGEAHSERENSFRFRIPARTLQDIFEEAKSPKLIDLMSLDVEGAELEVLSGIDFQKTNFRNLLIETRSINEIRSYLTERNYVEVARLSHHDYLFRWNQA